ncbi:hypothetical protein UFOVP84_71 [uncultured Caudovirales phage]|uniref:Uncharacterized protein n=1 Tax=uncultured Caudovirales phage TaxID=2100421 RepID=A0A6J5L1R0_9CAUD|nr:hypothetical protein UFOVP84_71 [uncultured Caudovirales phage]
MIKQYRWYDTGLRLWDDWKDINGTSEEETIKFAISKGYRYQIRTLEQTNIMGWCIDEQ